MTNKIPVYHPDVRVEGERGELSGEEEGTLCEAKLAEDLTLELYYLRPDNAPTSLEKSLMETPTTDKFRQFRGGVTPVPLPFAVSMRAAEYTDREIIEIRSRWLERRIWLGVEY